VGRPVSGVSVLVGYGEAAAAAVGVWGRNAPRSKTLSRRYSYDLAPVARFLFSNTHDVESDSFDFRLCDMCWTSDDGACDGASPPNEEGQARTVKTTK
jgi:hypothetical protein